MAYIKFIADGQEVRLYCGYMDGVVFTSNGQINFATSRPTIRYWGDRLSDKINLFTTQSLSMIDANGVQRSMNISTRGTYYTISMNNTLVAHTTGIYYGENVESEEVVIKQCTGGLIDLYQLDYDKFKDFQPISVVSTPPLPNQMVPNILQGVYADVMFFQCENGLIGITPTNLSNTWHPNVSRKADEGIGAVEYPFLICRGKWRYLKQVKNMTAEHYFQPTNMSTGLGYDGIRYTNVFNDKTLGSTFQNYMVIKNGSSYMSGGNYDFAINAYSLIALADTTVEPPPNNPEPDEGGGDGEKDDDSDTVDPPPEPPIEFPTNSKLFTLYRVETGQLDDIGSLIWSKKFTDSIFGVNQSPIDAIIDIYALPVTDVAGAYKTITVGNTETDISAQVPSKWTTVIDVGSVYLSRYYDDFIDYSADYSIYLPFIGIKQLPNFVVGCTISVQYTIDLLTGNCNAIVSLSELNSNLRSAMYTYEGNCSYEIPYTAQNLRNQAVKRIQGFEKLGLSLLSKDWGGALSTANNMYLQNMTENANVVTSDTGGNTAFLGIMTPYIIITRTKKHENSYNAYKGYVNMSDTDYSTLKGYTEIYEPHIYVDALTEWENKEIERLLSEGVIF